MRGTSVSLSLSLSLSLSPVPHPTFCQNSYPLSLSLLGGHSRGREISREVLRLFKACAAPQILSCSNIYRIHSIVQFVLHLQLQMQLHKLKNLSSGTLGPTLSPSSTPGFSFSSLGRNLLKVPTRNSGSPRYHLSFVPSIYAELNRVDSAHPCMGEHKSLVGKGP